MGQGENRENYLHLFKNRVRIWSAHVRDVRCRAFVAECIKCKECNFRKLLHLSKKIMIWDSTNIFFNATLEIFSFFSC